MDDLEILNNPTGINLAEFTWDDVRSLGNPEIKIYAKSSTNKRCAAGRCDSGCAGKRFRKMREMEL